MDQLIKDLEEGLIREVRASGSIDPIKLGALCSSFKDLTMARLLEELRTGRLEVRQWGQGWYLEPRR